jgi:Amt family ammonium transporter
MINFADTAFILICSAMVCFMTPGLAFFYGGLVRRKNALTIMMQSFICMGIVAVLWFLCGFSLAFGKDMGGVIGNLQFAFLNGVGMQASETYGMTIPFITFFIFQLMFAIIAPALITGAFADRFKFKSYLVFVILWSLLVYIPATHWVWGGGFLQKLGVADFAGGIVIHATAGFSALATVLFVGKRNMLPGEEAKPHNITYVALGTGLLWFGWFGFNGGSALAANGTAAIAFANTAIGGAVAMITWLVISTIHNKRPSIVEAMTGAVAGLATITPAAGYVAPWAAAVFGLCAGIVCYLAVMLRKKAGWDDALDVWGVHGIGGAFGSILLSVFAQKQFGGISGLIDGNGRQLWVQLVAVVFVSAYSLVVTLGMLKAMNAVSPVRVSKEDELKGLDEALFKEEAYSGL